MGHIPLEYNILNRVNKLTLSTLGCIEHTHINRDAIVFIVIDHLGNHGNTLYSRTSLLIREL